MSSTSQPSKSNKHKTFFCAVPGCGKVFHKKWNFSLHMKTHYKIRQFECEFCGKRFTQKSNFNKHMQIHKTASLKDRKRFECAYCSRKYTQNYNLKVRASSYTLFIILHLKKIGFKILRSISLFFKF